MSLKKSLWFQVVLLAVLVAGFGLVLAVQRVVATETSISSIQKRLEDCIRDNERLRGELDAAVHRISQLEGRTGSFGDILAVSIESDNQWRNHLTILLAVVGTVVAILGIMAVPFYVRRTVENWGEAYLRKLCEEQAEKAVQLIQMRFDGLYSGWDKKFEVLYDECRIGGGGGVHR